MHTLGFIGSGDLSERKTRSLLNDALDAHGEIRVILPVTQALWQPRIETVAAWALKTDEVSIQVVTDDTTEALTKSKTIDKALVADVLEAAVKTDKVAKPSTKIVSLLSAADGDLWAFWNDTDEDAYAAFERAWDNGTATYDACSGLEKMKFDEPGEEPEADDEPVPDIPDDEAIAEMFPTLEELEAMDLDEVIKHAAKLDIELPKRTRKSTYITAIKDKLAEAPGDEGVEELPDEDVEVPEDDRDDERLAADDRSNVERETGEVKDSDGGTGSKGQNTTAPPQSVLGNEPFVVAHCVGCGGPWLLVGLGVTDYHADLCPLIEPTKSK